MQETQTVLKKELQKFGLNPVEWTLRRLEETYYQIAHVEDQHFYFLGEAQEEGPQPQWVQIKLLSL